MSAIDDLGVEELDDFSPSPGLLTDLNNYVNSFLSTLSAFLS